LKSALTPVKLLQDTYVASIIVRNYEQIINKFKSLKIDSQLKFGGDIYRHSQEILVFPFTISFADSIATRFASQYSDSALSWVTTPSTYVTCLQILHDESDSHELKAQVIIKKAAVKISLRFIPGIFVLKNIKQIIKEVIFIVKRVFFKIIRYFNATI
jgi:hypothetical protein